MRRIDFGRSSTEVRRMKIKEAEILIVPGFKNSGPEHWQTRWENKMPTARRVEQAEWAKPVKDDWVERLEEEIEQARKPVVIIAHSLGVATAVHAVRSGARKVKGGFFVAPPDIANSAVRPKHLMTFGPYPRDPLPFPSFVVASRNDPFSSFDKAEDVADAWGSFLVDAGEAGHLNAESGHGPWPEGLLVFAEFMKRL